MREEPKSNTEIEWSPPDARGIRTCTLGFGTRATLKGRRFLRSEARNEAVLGEWPEDWLTLLRDCLRRDKPTMRWNTLLGIAGPARRAAADEVCEALLAAGWIELEERRESGLWRHQQLRFIALQRLRGLVGLLDRDELQRSWNAARVQLMESALVGPLLPALDAMQADIALRRVEWLQALERWRAQGRHGTYRDFALYATQSTKGIPQSDLDWLDQSIELNAFGVEAHQPLLYLRAALRLVLDAPLDLHAIPDLIGLSPATLRAVRSVEGSLQSWRFIENRTLFERIARRDGARHGVVWLPGYAPGWWREAMARLMRLMPAPVLIACDPDPDGVRIAFDAGKLCTSAGLSWAPWGMAPADLQSLPAQRPLEAADQRLLNGLDEFSLPAPLGELVAFMRTNAIKGEQEGLSLSRLEP